MISKIAYRVIKKIPEFKSDLSYQMTRAKYAKKLPLLDAKDRLIVAALNREGAYSTTLEDLGLKTTPSLLKAAHSQLSKMEAADNDHEKQKLPQIYTVTDLPEFAAWANEQRLLNIIESYIGLPVAFHGVHLRKDFPNENQFGTLLWHQDLEDRRIIKVIIYLSDVEEKHGPFEYIPRALTSFYRLSRLRYHGAIYTGITNERLSKSIPKSAWKLCPGKAGNVILVDTNAVLHHGTLRTEERSALFFVYTASPPKRPEHCTQYWDKTYARPELRL